MMFKLIFKWIVIACYLLFFTSTSFSIRSSKSVKIADNSKVGFRYVIFSNQVGRSQRNMGKMRFLKVLMEENKFSEENLKMLFRLLSARFPRPHELEISVVTNLSQIPTPEESDNSFPHSGSSEADWHVYEHHLAYMFRMGEEVYFRYNPNLPKVEWKVVVISGNDPQKSKRK